MTGTVRRVAAPTILGVALLAAALALWQAASSLGWLSPLAPTPTGTARRAVDILSDPLHRDGPADVGIAWHLLASVRRVLLGFAVAALVAVPLGFALGRSTTLRIGLALLRDAEHTAVFVIVLSAVWPTLISTVDAVRSVNPTYVNLAATLGTPWWSRLWNVWLPASLPGIVTGLRLSLSTSWLVIIAAEMLVGGQGIGFFVWTMWNRLDIDAIVVAIVLIGVIGLVLDHLVSAVQKVVRHD